MDTHFLTLLFLHLLFCASFVCCSHFRIYKDQRPSSSSLVSFSVLILSPPRPLSCHVECVNRQNCLSFLEMRDDTQTQCTLYDAYITQQNINSQLEEQQGNNFFNLGKYLLVLSFRLLVLSLNIRSRFLYNTDPNYIFFGKKSKLNGFIFMCVFRRLNKIW